MYHPKGWKTPKRQGYVKSHDAVRNGPSRDPERAKTTKLSDEQLAALGWKPAPKETLSAELQEYVELLKRNGGGQIYLPPVVRADGTVANIVQGRVEKDGPEQGHWSTVNGKRKWFKGQHNYNRQQNPRTNEPITETKVMNLNLRMEVVGPKYRDERTGKMRTIPDKNLVEDGRIIKLGRIADIKHADGWDGLSAKAFDRAARHIENGSAKFLSGKTTQTPDMQSGIAAQVQGGAGNTNGPSALEGTK